MADLHVMRFLDGWVVMEENETTPQDIYYSKQDAELRAKRLAEFLHSDIIVHDDRRTVRLRHT
jgi:hypothetical protein